MSCHLIENIFSKIFVCPHAEVLSDLIASRRVVVITDANVFAEYCDELQGYEHIVIEGGEANKNLYAVQSIYRQLMAMNADRSTLLLGVGGGIVTDITGFVAATYMRGLKYGFISTSLLGQVDASVGGKCGVNLDNYKNMVGCFSHPEFVILDVDMLRTLPQRELRSGMAEVVKSAIIGDKALFEMIERYATEDIYMDSRFMHEVVERSLRVKLSIVECDEREGGIRRLLNLGHTIGHAIEKLTHDYNHGEAVAIGIAMVCRVAVQRDMLCADESKRIVMLLERLGFATSTSIPIADIVREVKHDKKMSGSKLNLVVPRSIGHCEVVPLGYDAFVRLFE